MCAYDEWMNPIDFLRGQGHVQKWQCVGMLRFALSLFSLLLKTMIFGDTCDKNIV